MPFTLSHPAIVLPLIKHFGKWFSATGLIIGCITPDFSYFLRPLFKSNFSHSLFGIFYFDLPVGLLICFLFHNLIRNPLYSNLPISMQRRLIPFNSFNWNQYFNIHYWMVPISIVIGGLSHIFWDGLTHQDAIFVESFPALKYYINIFRVSVPMYVALQYLSSILGGICILLAYLRLPIINSDHSFSSLQPNTYWIIIFASLFIILTITTILGYPNNTIAEILSLVINSIPFALFASSFYKPRSLGGIVNNKIYRVKKQQQLRPSR